MRSSFFSRGWYVRASVLCVCAPCVSNDGGGSPLPALYPIIRTDRSNRFSAHVVVPSALSYFGWTRDDTVPCW